MGEYFRIVCHECRQFYRPRMAKLREIALNPLAAADIGWFAVQHPGHHLELVGDERTGSTYESEGYKPDPMNDPDVVQTMRKADGPAAQLEALCSRVALTPRQRDVAGFVLRYRAEYQVAPTWDEIADVLNISKTTVWEHVRAMESRGAARHDPRKARSLEILVTAAPAGGGKAGGR